MHVASAFPKTVLLIATCIGIIGFALPIGNAQTARIEVHPLQTMTLTDQQFLTGAKDGKPVVIAGELRLPRPGTDRLPAVVLVHGSGGVGANVDRWSQELNGLGVATFILDAFTGRGIVNTATNQAQLGQLTMINDAYRALELLSKHPRIDPARIDLMGFSRGDG
jgi:dienelactone hydrolase